MGKIGELDAGGRHAHRHAQVDASPPGKQTLSDVSPDGAEGSPRTGNDAPVTYQSIFALPQQGSGRPLPDSLRGRFEQSLGADLGGVRVHTGAASAASAEALGARAYAQGTDIHFGAGQFNPGTAEGDHLLAHEVAHTVQTGGAAADPKCKLAVSQPSDAAEVEADAAADAMVKGAPARVSSTTPMLHRKAAATSAPAAPANVQQNEQVDQKKIATLIANVSSVSERIGDCATSTGDECQELLTALTGGGMGSVVGNMNKLADTFTKASVNFEKELTAALKGGAPAKEMIAGYIKDQLGAAIDHQTKPTLDAIKTIDAIDKHVKAAYGALKGLGLDFAIELVMPKDPAGGVMPVVNAHLKKVENYEKVISLVGEVGRVSGRSGSLSSACLKVVPRLIQNLDALLLGGANTDGTIKAPSECEAAYKKLLPAKTACDAIKTELAGLTKKIMGMKSSAAVQADTDVTSAERQLWIRYYEMNPTEPWYEPACFGKDSRPLVFTNKLNMVKMIGKTGVCSASINTDGKKNPLLPNAPAMNSPGQIKVNNQTYRASAPNGKRIPVGTECRIVDAKVGVTVHGPVDEHEWELIVDADVPFEKTGPDETKANPATPGASFSPNEKADPKKMATLIDSVTATSEKIGATSDNTASTTTAMLNSLVDQSPAQGALGAFIQIGRVFDSAFGGFEAKIKAHDKAKADAHAIADKIVRYAITDAISYVSGPIKGIKAGVEVIDEKIGKVISDLEAAAIDYSVKLLVGEPPVETPIVDSHRINQLAQVEKLLALTTDISRLSGRSSKVSGATLKVVPKIINNLSALMHSSATADGTVKAPSEVEALANKITALGKECDAIAKTLTTTEARVNSVTITATNQAKVIDKPSAERQLWTKFLQEYPGAEMEIDMSSAFGNQPRPGLWANQMEMVKTIGKEGTVTQTINGGPAAPLVPGGVMVQVMSPGKVQIGNRQFKASSPDGKPLPVGTKVRVIDSKSGMTQHGTEMAENDWELIVQPAMGDAF